MWNGLRERARSGASAKTIFCAILLQGIIIIILNKLCNFVSRAATLLPILVFWMMCATDFLKSVTAKTWLYLLHCYSLLRLLLYHLAAFCAFVTALQQVLQ